MMMLLSGSAYAQQDKTMEAIDALKEVIVNAPEVRKPALMFRLAELHVIKAKELEAKEMLNHDTDYVRWLDGGQKGPPPELDRRESRAFLRTAVSLYRRVLDRAPELEEADQVTFNLAQALASVGETKGSVAQYLNLVKRYPKSSLVAKAYLLLGEHYFDANQLAKAEKALRRARKGDAETRIHAIYKLAWCDFNRTEYRAGIDKLLSVKRQGMLASEADRDLALFYAHAEAIDDALATYKQLDRLAAILDEQGKWPLALRVKRHQLEKKPSIGAAARHRGDAGEGRGWIRRRTCRRSRR